MLKFAACLRSTRLAILLFLASLFVVPSSAYAQEPTAAPENDEGRVLYLRALEQFTAGNKEAMFRLYLRSAELGYLESQHQTGWCYEFGDGVTQSYSKGFTWHTKAANAGHAESALGLGRYHEYGYGDLDVDLGRAKEWYEEAQRRGSKGAQDALDKLGQFHSFFNRAMNAFGNVEFEQSFKLFQSAAAEGDERAFLWMGWSFQNGNGIEINYLSAAKWFYKAATETEDDKLNASYELAAMYGTGGHGLKQDLDKSREWLRYADRHGHEEAAEIIRELDQGKNRFETDDLKSRAKDRRRDGNLKEALRLHNEIVATGDAESAIWIGRIYFRGAEGVEQDAAEARKWFHKAGQLGNRQADYWIKLLDHPANADYLAGERLRIGFKDEWTDAVAAFHAYYRAAQHGHPQACELVGLMYRMGIGMFKDIVLGRVWTLKAAELGDPVACWHAGTYFENYEDGVDQAIKWYRHAAELDYEVEDSKRRIANLANEPKPTAKEYLNRGNGFVSALHVPVDEQAAIANYNKAIELGSVSALARLGNVYFERGDRANKLNAFEYYRRAAERDHDVATALMAFAYNEGKIFQRDWKQAAEWAQRAWELGYQTDGIQRVKSQSEPPGETDFVKALTALFHHDDEETSRVHFVAAAEAGHPIAPKYCLVQARDWQTWTKWAAVVAEMDDFEGFNGFPDGLPGQEDYRSGLKYSIDLPGRIPDFARANEFYRAAADKGHPGAMNFLASNLFVGQGIEKDEQAALELCRQAVAAGLKTQAVHNLGASYLEALAVDADIDKSLEYYQIAADHGYENSKSFLQRYNREVATPAGRHYWTAEGLRTKDRGWRDAKSAAESYRKAADLGFENAQYRLGEMYLGDHLGERDIDQAIAWFTQAAEAGDMRACRKLGDLYREGELVKQDRVAARKWYRAGLKAGDQSQNYQLYRMDYDGQPGEVEYLEASRLRELKNPAHAEKIARLLKVAADEGHANAAFRLGEAYLTGSGVEYDGNSARQWLTFAADNYIADAAKLLGTLHAWGIGGPQDKKHARLYLNKADELLRNVQLELASLDREGYLGEQEFRAGIAAMHGWMEPPSYAKAKELLLRAADLGHHPARVQLGNWHVDRVIDIDKDELKRHILRASVGNYGPASTLLGKWYRTGEVVSKDRSSAEWDLEHALNDGDQDALLELLRLRIDQYDELPSHDLFQEAEELAQAGRRQEADEKMLAAAELGHPEACLRVGSAANKRGEPEQAIRWYEKAEAANLEMQSSVNLAFLYSEGRGVEKDLDRAFAYAKRAADKGYPRGQVQLGYFYELGYGVEKDIQHARKLYRLAAIQDAGSMHNLGSIWLHGKGVERDPLFAENWFRLAVVNGRSESDLAVADSLFSQFRDAIEPTEDQLKIEPASLFQLRNAAERGQVAAQEVMAVMYDTGNGGERDWNKARRWYQLAIDNGSRISEWRLEQAEELGEDSDRSLMLGVLHDRLNSVALAEKYFGEAARASNLKAARALGVLMLRGPKEQWHQALRWITFVADNTHDPKVARYVAESRYHEVGGASNSSSDIEYARRAHFLGHKLQQDQQWSYLFYARQQPGEELRHQAWRAYHIDKNFERAAELHQQAAEEGNTAAMLALGEQYLFEKGVRENVDLGLTWLLRAAEADDPRACYRLASLMELSDKIDHDTKAAEKWARRAIELGHAGAERFLTIIYYNRVKDIVDEDVERGWDAFGDDNLDEAAGLLLKPAEAGNADATFKLGKVEQFRKNYEQANNWFRKATESQDRMAPYELGVHYEHGRGVEKDMQQAIDYYRIAASRGYNLAQRYLGYCYQVGRGVDVDLEQAVDWYLRAIDIKDPELKADVMHRLATIFFNDKFLYRDKSIGMYWYRQAAELGNERAQEVVARLQKFDPPIVDVPNEFSDELLDAAYVWTHEEWGKARRILGAQIIFKAADRGSQKAKDWRWQLSQTPEGKQLFADSGFENLRRGAESGSDLFMQNLAFEFARREQWDEALWWGQKADEASRFTGVLNTVKLRMKEAQERDVRREKAAELRRTQEKTLREIPEPKSIIVGDVTQALIISAQSGLPEAMIELARRYARAGEWELAQHWAKKLSERAKVPLAPILDEIKKELPTEAEVKQKPAEPADAAQSNSQPKKTIPKDDPVLKRAQAGDPQSQFIIGRRYHAFKQYELAKEWTEKSAAQGFKPAIAFLKRLEAERP